MDFGFASVVLWAVQDLKRKIIVMEWTELSQEFIYLFISNNTYTLQVTLIITMKLGETKYLKKWPWKNDLDYRYFLKNH